MLFRSPACRSAGAVEGDPPQITSPVRGSVYAVRIKQSADTRIAFNATADASAHALYWFVNDAYAGKTAAGEAMFWQPPTAGEYNVRVVDDHGRNDQRRLQVQLVE